jgi:ribosome maturation factor RimP
LTPSDRRHLEELIGPLLDPLGLYLIEFVVRGDAAKRIIEVYVDSDAGVSADQCGEASRCIAPVFDAAASFKGSYTLTVSSPGLDRPLKFPRQYAKHKGRTLLIRWKSGDGNRQCDAVLEEAAESSITVRMDHDEPLVIAYSDIIEARVRPRW